MYCKNCGTIVEDGAKFCASCGAPINAEQAEQPSYFQAPPVQMGLKNKLVAGLLAILLGSLGIHKFYLGYTKPGIIMLLVSLLTCGFGAAVMQIIGIVEGIMYLTKTDEEFYATYEASQKEWF